MACREGRAELRQRDALPGIRCPSESAGRIGALDRVCAEQPARLRLPGPGRGGQIADLSGQYEAGLHQERGMVDSQSSALARGLLEWNHSGEIDARFTAR